MDGEKVLHEDMGGEVAERLKGVHGLEYPCRCGNDVSLNKGKGGYIMGYPHRGGVEDGDGESWWMFISCPECGFEITFWKTDDELIDPIE